MVTDGMAKTRRLHLDGTTVIVNHTCPSCRKSNALNWLRQIVYTAHRVQTAKWGPLNRYTPEGQSAPTYFGIGSERCSCGRVMEQREIVGRVAEWITCDAQCWNATGHHCQCSCGGANHGRSHRPL